MKCLVLSETVNHNEAENNLSAHYRNLGATEVASRLFLNNVPVTVIEWFSCWPSDLLKECCEKWLHGDPEPVVAVSTPMKIDPIDSIADTLKYLKKTIPNLKIIHGGLRTVSQDHLSLFDAVFLGRSMEPFLAWLNKKSMQPYATKYPGVYINHMVDFNIDTPVLPFYREEDYLTPQDILGFEIGIGCKFNCTFCNYDLRGANTTTLQHGTVLAQMINDYYDKWGVKNYFFSDDTVNESPKKLHLLHDLYTSTKIVPNLTGFFRLDLMDSHLAELSQLPLHGMQLGIETFNPKAARLVRKSGNAKKQIELLEAVKQAMPGTALGSGFIVGLTGDNEKHIRQSIMQAVRSNLLDMIYVNPLAIIEPETDVFDSNYQSEIQKDPAKYGYFINSKQREDRYGAVHYDWHNDWCNWARSKDISRSITDQLSQINFPYGSTFDWLSFVSLGTGQKPRDMGNFFIRKRTFNLAIKLKNEYIKNKSSLYFKV